MSPKADHIRSLIHSETFYWKQQARELQAIVKVQRVVRGHAVRRAIQECIRQQTLSLMNLIITVQAHCRGNNARRAVLKLKLQRLKDKRIVRIVSRLQARHRGRFIRKCVEEANKHFEEHVKQREKELRAALKWRAAVHIQALARGVLTRKMYNPRRQRAALQMQAMFYVLFKRFSRVEKRRAAVKIQAMLRGAYVRHVFRSFMQVAHAEIKKEEIILERCERLDREKAKLNRVLSELETVSAKRERIETALKAEKHAIELAQRGKTNIARLKKSLKAVKSRPEKSVGQRHVSNSPPPRPLPSLPGERLA